MSTSSATCVFCDHSETVTLISLSYKDMGLKICAQHLPILIRDPAHQGRFLDIFSLENKKLKAVYK